MFPSFVFSFVSKISVYIFHISKKNYSFGFVWASSWILFLFLSFILYFASGISVDIFLVSIYPKITYLFFFLFEFCLVFSFTDFILYFSYFYISQNDLFILFYFWVLSCILLQKFQPIFFNFYISKNNLFVLFHFWVFSCILFHGFHSIFFIFLYFPKNNKLHLKVLRISI